MPPRISPGLCSSLSRHPKGHGQQGREEATAHSMWHRRGVCIDDGDGGDDGNNGGDNLLIMVVKLIIMAKMAW